jgi:hypothetical protein
MLQATRTGMLAWVSNVCHSLSVIDQVAVRRLAEHCADAQRVAQALHGDLDALRAERARAERVVATLDLRIAAIEQLAGAMTNLTAWEDDAMVTQKPLSDLDSAVVPQQRPLVADVPVTASAEAPAMAVEAATRRSGTYRELVLPLLAQDPQRWWKAREVAEAIGVEKVASAAAQKVDPVIFGC